MPTPCSVCTHNDRAEIDALLARQVINLSALGELKGLGRDALRNHREKHLPTFLPSLVATYDVAPSKQHLLAEVKRLYDIALDELAAAQAGITVESKADKDGNTHEVRRVSNAAVVRSLDVARRVLGDMGKLALDGPTPEAGKEATDVALSVRITAALDRADQRQLEGPVSEAQVIEADGFEVEAGQEAAPARASAAGGVGGSTPGPGAGSGPGPASTGVGPISTATPAQTLSPLIQSSTEAAGQATQEPAGNTEDRWAKYRWDGNPAASDEEKRAAGHRFPPPKGSAPVPSVDPDPRAAFRP